MNVLQPRVHSKRNEKFVSIKTRKTASCSIKIGVKNSKTVRNASDEDEKSAVMQLNLFRLNRI